jgi:ribosomal protein S18 acetylase RimI-like enzyme
MIDNSSFSAAGLAPVAVLPELQRQGIGSKLIREGLKLCGQLWSGSRRIVPESAAKAAKFGDMNAAFRRHSNHYVT